MLDEARIECELSNVREAIRRDWASLASNELTSDQRKAIRQDLEMNIAALHDLLMRKRLAAETAKLRRLQNRDYWS